MSLRLKFGVLLALLGLAVMLTLGASWWAFAKLQSEVSDPLRSMAGVLVTLGEAKQHIEQSRHLFELPSARKPGEGGTSAEPTPTNSNPPPDDRELARAALVRARVEFPMHMAAVRTLIELPSLANEWKIRSGATTYRNLLSRISESESLGQTYFIAQQLALEPPNNASETDHALAARDAARDAVTRTHDLVERVEDFVTQEMLSAGVDFSGDMRTKLLWTLGWAFVIVLLTVALGIVLVRRWILNPVAALRTAAARIAAGDFAHRIALPPDSHPDELHQLSAEVNQMAGMVKSMQDDRVERERLAALGEMVRRLAHNLRNPLAGIRGLAEITRSDLTHLGPASNELSENQSRIIIAVDRFEKWLNDLLGATRPMALQPEPTEIARWLTGLVDAHRPMAQTRGVDLFLDTTDSPPTADFDSRHLEHALSAMLSNAIESTSSPQARGSTPIGGSVRLKVQSAPVASGDVEMGKTWIISITDQGTGIPPDLRESIFRPYFTTKRDGNGIGLAVALSVVKAHGGQIVVESPWPPRENGALSAPEPEYRPAGARFTICLPMSRPALANNGVAGLASDGQSGAVGGQDTRHRG